MSDKLGVVGIVISDPKKDAGRVNDILSLYDTIIVGRMGIPYREKGVSVIAVTVDGSNDKIGAMTGKLGQIESVVVKSALTSPKNTYIDREKNNEKNISI